MSTLVVGATGSIGAAYALELIQRRDPVRLLVRSKERARARFGARVDSPMVKTIVGDALDEKTVVAAAEGCEVIVHAVSFPLNEWAGNMERATLNIISAARNSRATIVYPGNVYALGPQTSAPIKEDAANLPTTEKGRLRAKLENGLLEACDTTNGRVKVLIVRAGDYFGPTARNPILDMVFQNALDKKPIRVLGNPKVPHQWAYTRDLARAMADLALSCSKFETFEVVNFPGHIARPAVSFYKIAAERAGRGTLQIKPIPWWILQGMAIVKKELRDYADMKYLYDSAVILDGAKFRKLFPTFNETPLELALDETIAGYRRDNTTAEAAPA